MTTAQALTEQAIALAGSGADQEAAVQALLDTCGDRRVPVVRARQQIVADDGAADADTASRVIELLDAVLERLPV